MNLSSPVKFCSNYVVYMSRHANEMILDLDNFVLHPWNENISIKQESLCIPSDMTEFLYSSNTDGVTQSIKPDENLEEIDFGYEESNVEEDIKIQRRQ